MSQLMAWMPYIIIAVILMLTRNDFLPFKAWLMANGEVIIKGILGFAGPTKRGMPAVDATLRLLYIPGILPFMVIALLTGVLHKMSPDKVAKAWIDTTVKMKAATIALVASVALVAIFRGSGMNPAIAAQVAAGTAKNLPSMPLALATAVAGALGSVWFMFASFIGGLGAFITGSHTVSNMLFGAFQWDMAGQLGLQKVNILAGQSAGGAMGNMVCIHNIIAACTVVGLVDREGEILKKTVVPFILYGFVVGIVVFMLIQMNWGQNTIFSGF
jgi:lactate permease